MADNADNPGAALPARADRDVRAGVPRAPVVLGGWPRAGDDPRPGGLLGRRARHPAGRPAPQEHAGHRAGGVVRHRRTAGLPVAAAADDVQDRPLHPLRGARAQPVRAARQRRHAVSAARRHGAGPALGTVHHRGAAAGRAARRAPGHRAGHHSDGGAAHPSDDDDRARQRQGADRRSPAVGGRGAGAGQRVEPAGVPDGPARPRGRRLHRARAALSGPDRLPAGRRGAAGRGRQERLAADPAGRAGRSRAPRCTTRSTSRSRRAAKSLKWWTALERQYDAFVAAQENRSLLARDEDLPSGDELGAEFERFLAQQAGDKFKEGSQERRQTATSSPHPARQRSWRNDASESPTCAPCGN